MAKDILSNSTTTLLLGAGALYLIYKSNALQNISQGIGNIGSGIGSGVGDIGSGLGNGVSEIGGGVLALGAGLGSGLSGLGQGIGGGVFNIGTGFENVGSGFMNLQTELGAGFEQLLAGIGSFGANIQTSLGTVKIGANANANNSNVTGNTTVMPSTNSDKQVNSSTTKIQAKAVQYGIIANEFGGYSPTINGVQQLQSVQAPTNAPKSNTLKVAVVPAVSTNPVTQTYALGQQYLSAVLNNRGTSSIRL
jgi:hypothetical protein